MSGYRRGSEFSPPRALRGTSPAIVVQQIHKRYGDVRALEGLEFDVKCGSVLSLLGPNGAGKTTIVRILTTLARADSGAAFVAGIDVAGDPQRVRQVIGLAGQAVAIQDELSGRENLVFTGRFFRLPTSKAHERAGELLELFDLTADADRLAGGYSGGMKRRLDLALSLVHKPEVLFLDEPTNGLDPQSRRRMWSLIKELAAGGTTVLMTTQHLEEADEVSDEVVILNAGAAIAKGTPDTLKALTGGDIIEVTVPDNAAVAASAVLSAVGQRAVRADSETGVFTVLADSNTSSTLIATVRSLDRAGIAVTGVEIRRPSLEDAFLSLTGPAHSLSASSSLKDPDAR